MCDSDSSVSHLYSPWKRCLQMKSSRCCRLPHHTTSTAAPLQIRRLTLNWAAKASCVSPSHSHGDDLLSLDLLNFVCSAHPKTARHIFELTRDQYNKLNPCCSLQDRKIQERSATYTATSLLLSDESDVLKPSFVDNLTRVQGHSAASKTVQLVSTECVVSNSFPRWPHSSGTVTGN